MASGTDPAPSARLIPGWLVLLGALTALAPLSIDMYLPALPTIAQAIGAPEGRIGLTLAAFFIGMALGQLFYGPISDRFGRKKPLYVGLIIYVLASLGCMAATTLSELVVLRLLQALGGCAGGVIARAIVRDRCSAREMARAFSMLMLVMGLAPILAPIVGGWLLVWMDWRWLFFVLALFGAGCLAALFWRLPESHDPRRAEPLSLGNVLGGYVRLLGNRGFLGYILCGGFGMAGLFAYITGSPFLFIELYSLTPQQYSLVFGGTALVLVAAGQLNARLLQRVALSTLLRYAVCSSPLAGVMLLVLSQWPGASWWMYWCALMLFTGGLGFITPNSTAAALATHGQQAGMASALLGSMQFLLATVSGTLVGLWHDGSSLPLAVVMLVCGACVWLSYFLLARLHGVRP